MRRQHPLLLGAALALAGAAPAAAAEVQVNAVEPTLATPAWDRTALTLLPGDTVVWRFEGTQLPHNVRSLSGPWSFRTEPGIPGAPGSFTFASPGTYVFVCEVHETQMSGTVTVGDPPPPPLSEQPFPNDATAPLALETGGLDEAAPSIGGVRARGGRLRFRVSEPSDVTIRFKRGGRTVATRHVHVAGTYRMAVRASRSLRAGRYRVELRARDGAGNDSRLRGARLTVR